MTFSKLLASAAIFAIAAVPFTLPVSAHADTYKIFDLGSDNGFNLVGIDTAGTVVISDPSCLQGGSACYDIYVNGVFSSTSATVPSLNYDNGAPCVPSLPSGIFSFTTGVCNNGHEVFQSGTSGRVTPGLYTGPDPAADFLHGQMSIGFLKLNASGDIAWSDPFNEENFVAIDLTTDVVPEPNALVLLATGVIGAAGALRRRLVSSLR